MEIDIGGWGNLLTYPSKFDLRSEMPPHKMKKVTKLQNHHLTKNPVFLPVCSGKAYSFWACHALLLARPQYFQNLPFWFLSEGNNIKTHICITQTMIKTYLISQGVILAKGQSTNIDASIPDIKKSDSHPNFTYLKINLEIGLKHELWPSNPFYPALFFWCNNDCGWYLRCVRYCCPLFQLKKNVIRIIVANVFWQ